jgi:hypothetical protein
MGVGSATRCTASRDSDWPIDLLPYCAASAFTSPTSQAHKAEKFMTFSFTYRNGQAIDLAA